MGAASRTSSETWSVLIQMSQNVNHWTNRFYLLLAAAVWSSFWLKPFSLVLPKQDKDFFSVWETCRFSRLFLWNRSRCLISIFIFKNPWVCVWPVSWWDQQVFTHHAPVSLGAVLPVATRDDALMSVWFITVMLLRDGRCVCVWGGGQFNHHIIDGRHHSELD